MSLVVIEDKVLGPTDAGLLSAVGIVLEPYRIAHLVEQSVGLSCNASLQEPTYAHGAELRQPVE